jgi:hypothetical protein
MTKAKSLFFPSILKCHASLPFREGLKAFKNLKQEQGGSIMMSICSTVKVRLKEAHEVKVPALLEEVRGYITEGELKTYIALCSLVRKKLKGIHQLSPLWGEKDYKKILNNLWFCKVYTHGLKIKLAELVRERGIKKKGTSYADIVQHIKNLFGFVILSREIDISSQGEKIKTRGYHLIEEFDIEIRGHPDRKGEKREETTLWIRLGREPLVSLFRPGYRLDANILSLKGAPFFLALFLSCHSWKQAFSEERLIKECRFSESILKKGMARQRLYQALDILQKKGICAWRKVQLHDGRAGIQIFEPHSKRVKQLSVAGAKNANRDLRVENRDLRVENRDLRVENRDLRVDSVLKKLGFNDS